MNKLSRTCDHCNAELMTETSYPHNWTLSLKCEDTNRNNTEMMFAIHMPPMLDREYHFCGLQCLGQWVCKGG